MSDINKVIDKIKKLLALAGDAANANEAASAAAMANKLLDEHRLSACDLETEDSTLTEPIEEDSDYLYQSGKITHYKRLLIQILAAHYGCALWNDWHSPQGRKVSRYRLVGKRSDIGITRYMFHWLMAECERLSNKEAKGKGRVFVNSYCNGFVSGVAEQLKASRVEVQQQATSSAIVKIDARLAQSEEELYRLHNNLKHRTTYSYSRRDGAAYAAGQQRGKDIHLGASIASGGTRLLNK